MPVQVEGTMGGSILRPVRHCGMVVGMVVGSLALPYVSEDDPLPRTRF